jgi:hypothetical protein
MLPLAAGAISLRDPSTGGNITTLSVDPTEYRPFENAKRGSTHQVLSGSVVHQDFGLQPMDFILSINVEITDYETLQDLWTKYRVTGAVWELRDWFPNKFHVIFAPGQASFNPVPIRGSCSSFEVQMTLYVVRVVEFFGNPY